MRHLNRESLNLLKKVGDNGVSSSKTAPDCDVCAVGKIHQPVHPKTAGRNVQRCFQLLMTDMMGPFTPGVLRGFEQARKISNEPIR